MIVQVGAGDDVFAAVLKLAKRAKQTVGFLSDAAFKQRARNGTLLAVVEADQVVAYAMFDLPGDRIRLVQLVVDPDRRGSGQARALLEEITRRHGSRRGIRLSCRNDFDANSFWPHLGFTPLAERSGRSIAGHLLTTWWLSFHHADLLSLLDEADDRERALLDSCVFFDLVADAPPTYIDHLSADWLADQIHIGVSSEVFVEIRGADADQRQRQRNAAHPLLIPETAEANWANVLAALHEACPDAPVSDENDLRQIAKAVAADARWLVTTDDTMRGRYGSVAFNLGELRIVSPEQLIREVDSAASTDRYRPAELAKTAVTIREMDPGSVHDLAARFVNHAAGETIRQLRDVLKAAAARPKSVQVQTLEVAGEPRAVACIEAVDERWVITVLRVSPGRGDTVLARHLLAKVRADALAAGVRIVVLTDERASAVVKASTIDEGFLATHIGHVAVSLHGAYGPVELSSLLDELWVAGTALLPELFGTADATAAAAAEAMFAPVRVLGMGLPTYVVPIKSHWAAGLFDAELASRELFHRPWDLGLRRELVFYRSPRNAHGISAPARIVWYVTGTRAEPRSGSLRAVSLLDEVVIGRPDVLHHRFSRLGVYAKAEVTKAASNGRAMALRFSNTQLWPTPVTLAAYREMVDRHLNRKPVLRGPEEISDTLFADLHHRGSGG